MGTEKVSEFLSFFTSNYSKVKRAYFEHVLIQKDKWLAFISDKERETEVVDGSLLAACFDVIVSLPVRKELKLDLHVLSAKIMTT